MPAIVKDDPRWLDPKDPHRGAYTRQGLLGPTVPSFWVFNPAYAQVQNEHVWQTAWAEIMNDGVAPQASVSAAQPKSRSRNARTGSMTRCDAYLFRGAEHVERDVLELDGDAARQLRQALLQLLLVVIRGRLLDLRA
jgi:hypothetical protein